MMNGLKPLLVNRWRLARMGPLLQDLGPLRLAGPGMEASAFAHPTRRFNSGGRRAVRAAAANRLVAEVLDGECWSAEPLASR